MKKKKKSLAEIIQKIAEMLSNNLSVGELYFDNLQRALEPLEDCQQLSVAFERGDLQGEDLDTTKRFIRWYSLQLFFSLSGAIEAINRSDVNFSSSPPSVFSGNSSWVELSYNIEIGRGKKKDFVNLSIAFSHETFAAKAIFPADGESIEAFFEELCPTLICRQVEGIERDFFIPLFDHLSKGTKPEIPSS